MKAFDVIKLRVTIQTDENGEVFDVNITDGYRSISYAETMPTLKEILEDFGHDE